jgi:hypothetical protein
MEACDAKFALLHCKDGARPYRCKYSVADDDADQDADYHSNERTPVMYINRQGFDDKHTNWVDGLTPDDYSFSAKVYTEPSPYGMPTPEHPKGGNISILILRDLTGTVVFHYDRGRYLVDMVSDMALDAAIDVAAILESEFIEA